MICFNPEYSNLDGYWTIQGIVGEEQNFLLEE